MKIPPNDPSSSDSRYDSASAVESLRELPARFIHLAAELRVRDAQFIERRVDPVDFLVKRVDQLQRRVVEHSLVVRERLDVPAQERPEQLLERQRQSALQ